MSTSPITLPIHDYLAIAPPEHKWLIEGIIAKPSYALLIGDGKSGKSTLALQMSLAVAQGTPFLGYSTTPGRVLYIQCDVSEFTWHLMLRNFQRGGERIMGDVHLVRPDRAMPYLDVLHTPTITYLKEVRDSCHPDMVVLDLLRELHSGDEQDSTAMRIVINNILSVFGNVGLLLIHHTSKLDPSLPADPIRSSRGSSYVANRADNVLLLHANRLVSRGRFGVPLSIPLWRRPSGFWAIA